MVQAAKWWKMAVGFLNLNFEDTTDLKTLYFRGSMPNVYFPAKISFKEQEVLRQSQKYIFFQVISIRLSNLTLH